MATTPIPLVNAVIAFAVFPISSTESFVFEALPFRYTPIPPAPSSRLLSNSVFPPFISIPRFSLPGDDTDIFPAPVILIS